MDFQYSLLKDDLAINEIRKHKWLESEKAGQEIGFASAAIDWIDKYSQAWTQSRIKMKDTDGIYCEKRFHRRFKCQLPVQISNAAKSITTYTDDINLLGLACTVPDYFKKEEIVDVLISFEKGHPQIKTYRFSFKSKVSIKNCTFNDSALTFHRLFLPFSEEVRDFLRLHAPDQFANEPVAMH